MLRKRIIPIVLLDGFSVLKTINFNQRRNLGSPITVARTYNTRDVDELVLLDIDATKQGRSIDKFTIAEIAQDCFMPLTVGGGITSIKDIQDLLAKGADKVAINTFAIKNPLFIREAADIFGCQCIVVSIDVIEVENEGYAVFNNGHIVSELDLFYWIKEVVKLGAGELLINNVTADGSMAGVNIDLAKKIAELVNVPVIYAGGVSSPDDAVKICKTRISAVGISSIFHFTDNTPDACKFAMKDAGLCVR